MTRARNEQIPVGSYGVFHLVTRCVRRSLLLMEGDRRTLISRGLASWLGRMGIDLLGYAIMGNHLHLVVRLRPDVVAQWDAPTVARHALAVLPVRSGPGLEPLQVTPAMVERYSGNAEWLAEQRERLSSPSWLMRLVKQELSRRANAEDGCTGHFWERRFTSVALVDAAAVLACLVYVDLNPLRAGLVSRPETADFTSIRHRFQRVRGTTRYDHDAPDADLGRRLVAMPACAPVNDWTGAQESWSVDEASYLDLVEQTGRMVVDGKRGVIPNNVPPLAERLGISAANWLSCMGTGGSMLGSVVGSPVARQQWATANGQRWAADKSGLWSAQ